MHFDASHAASTSSTFTTPKFYGRRTAVIIDSPLNFFHSGTKLHENVQSRVHNTVLTKRNVHEFDKKKKQTIKQNETK